MVVDLTNNPGPGVADVDIINPQAPCLFCRAINVQPSQSRCNGGGRYAGMESFFVHGRSRPICAHLRVLYIVATT